MNRKKQFIAGAICPKCSEIDSLVLYTDDQSVACVICNYIKSSQQRDLEASQSTKKKTNISYKDTISIKITNLDK